VVAVPKKSFEACLPPPPTYKKKKKKKKQKQKKTRLCNELAETLAIVLHMKIQRGLLEQQLQHFCINQSSLEPSRHGNRRLIIIINNTFSLMGLHFEWLAGSLEIQQGFQVKEHSKTYQSKHHQEEPFFRAKKKHH
jgi:hypothetical protein